MSLFQAGLQPALDDNGHPISGAKWRFYATGTSTPVAVYSDEDLTTSAGTFITADASGRFDPVWLNDASGVRAVLEDDEGNLIAPYDIDPVNGDFSNYSEFVRNTGPSIADTIDAKGCAILLPSGIFNETGIELSDHQTVIGNNAVFASQATGPMFSMSGYRPLVDSLYLQGNTTGGYLFEVDGGPFAAIRNVIGANAGAGGIYLKNDVADASGCRSGNVENTMFQDVTGIGFRIGTGVNKWTFDNCETFGKIDFTGGLGKPRDNSTGWTINPANRTIGVGGHQFVNCRAESVDFGWTMSGTQLLMLSNCFADGCSDYGLIIDDSDNIDIDHFFCGTTRGVWVGGTSSDIMFRDLTTMLTGVIPPWGTADFFNGEVTFFDVSVADTASVTIDGNSWRGGKRVSVASGATLTVQGGQEVTLDSEGTVTASTTVYLKPGGGTTATEADAAFRADFDGVLFMIQARADDDPTSGNHVYTVRTDTGSGFADTALTCSIPNGSFAARAYHGGISVTKGTPISIRLDAGAGVNARHDVLFQLLEA